jgi:hypothetical protein
MSIKKSHASFTGTSRSILPSKIIGCESPREIQDAILCEKNGPDNPARVFSQQRKERKTEEQQMGGITKVGPVHRDAPGHSLTP